ncbi:MAG: NfeD family protein [Firmicutes bacterium]|nr:NfeD family protein [Bacillota bacterium]
MVLMWLLLALLALLGELLTMAFYAVYEAVAALLTALVAAVWPSFAGQVAAFALFSGILLGVVRPRTVELLFRARPQPTVPFPDLAGKAATVRERVTDHGGLVEVGEGEFWSARAYPPGSVFERGTAVTVAYRDGLRLYVQAQAAERGDREPGP